MHTGGAEPIAKAVSARVERRHVTVLFADLSGSSQLAEEVEAELYLELLDEFRHIARTVISRHGGSIARAQGDGVLVLFGHPVAREDDGRRATEAALELHARVAQLRAGSGPAAGALQMHSGIHAGVLVVSEGDIERGRFDVTGEVANTAFRLCSAAAAGEILVSEATLGPHQDFFSASAPFDMEIRGRARELRVLRILGRSMMARRFEAVSRRGSIPFIGRRHALETLHEAARRARGASSPALLLVMGEPGVGKTRLLQEFEAGLPASDFRVLQGYCENYLGAEPLQPFVQLIRASSARSGTAAPEGTSGAKPPNAIELVAALIELITIAHRRTVVLVLDDWQWADDASRQALEALLARPTPMLVVLASRPTQASVPVNASAQTLHLQPLSDAETGSAVAATLESEEPFLAQEIYRQSGGTPLFIEELCHAATRGELSENTPEINVAWISALVASRVSQLPPEQAELLRAASVAGNVFPDWLLQQLTGDDISALLQALVAADFLAAADAAGMLRFKHKLTRDAVYATVTLTERRRLHQRVAEALESAAGDRSAYESLEALSYHYDAAGGHARAAHYAEAAGDKALGAMALDRARDQYTAALRAMRESVRGELSTLRDEEKRRWCAIAQKLGQACVFDPLGVADGLRLFEDARTVAVDLAQASGDLNVLARAEYWLAYIQYSRGRARESVSHAELALRHATDSGDAKLVAQVEATLGQALASAGRYERALPLLDDAVARKRQHSRVGSGTAIGSAYSLARKAYTLGDLGRFEEAHAAFDEALVLLGDKVHSVRSSVMELVCAVHLWQGRWDEAEAAGLEGADIAWRCRSRYLLLMGRALAACGGWMRKHDEASLQMLRKSNQWIEERGGAVSTSLTYGWLVEAAARRGDVAAARQHAVGLFQRARAQDRHGLGMGCRALARVGASRGDVAASGHYMQIAESAAAFRGSARERAQNELARAEIAHILGHHAQAQGRAMASANAFSSMQMSWHAARARTLAATQDYDGAPSSAVVARAPLST